MANITKVYLLAVPLEKDYVHTLYFGSAAEQQTYFQSKIKKSYTDFSYQRKDGVIRAPEHIDDLIAAGCNYVMYQNAAYSNRWFYAFIEDMEYINDGRTDVKIRTDCIQTWMFDINVLPSFVDREHASSDEIGEHTIDETLELGEYICNMHSKSGMMEKGCVIVVGATKTADGEQATGNIYEGIYSGVKYYVFPDNPTTKITEFLSEYDADAAAAAITCMFLAPAAFSPLYEITNQHPSINQPWQFWINDAHDLPAGAGQSSLIGMTTNTLNGYTPRNAKLLTSPFRYLLVSNNNGAAIPYKYEQFYTMQGNTKIMLPPQFVIEGCITPGCSIRMVPLDYKGIYRNDEEGINMGKFPTLNWTSDAFTNWLTQNAVNIGLDIAMGVGQIVAGSAVAAGTGGLGAGMGAGSIVGGISQIAGTLAQVHQQSMVPPQSRGNINAGDVITASNQNDFHFYDMTIKKEKATIIDEYFDMYGYKCQRVKIPEKAHRAAYWYTKTIDANIIGNIPQGDLQVIKDCYNRGITFWRNTANFKDYSVANGIV